MMESSTATDDTGEAAALADYIAAEDAMRAFTDRNFGRLCAMCARWTLLAARVNAESAPPRPAGFARSFPAAEAGAVTWRLSSWVTNCCNANHALESMSEDSLAGIVASREEGQRWWEHVRRVEGGPCAALTGEGCALTRGRPELCNKYFCEAVRDYLWQLCGERHGAELAAQLDALQQRWTRLYGMYQTALRAHRETGAPLNPGRLRHLSGCVEWPSFLDTFDAAIASCARPVAAETVADRLFKVSGDETVYRPFFQREVDAIGGMVRQ